MNWDDRRIEDVWDDLKSTINQNRDPIQLLRRRFRKKIGRKDIDQDTSNKLSELWCFWGILNVMQILNGSSFTGRKKYHGPSSLLNSALDFCSDLNTKAAIIYNIGSCNLLYAVEVCDQPMQFASQLGFSDQSLIDFRLNVDFYNYNKLKQASDLYFRAYDLFGSGLPARFLACFTACAYGTLAITGPPRTRKRYLKKACENLDGSNKHEKKLQEICLSAVSRLSSQSIIIRLLGRKKTMQQSQQIIPGLLNKKNEISENASYFSSIIIKPAELFVLPEKYYTVFNVKKTVDRLL